MNVPVWPTRPPWARESRFRYVDLRDRPNHPGTVVSTGSTTRHRGLDRLDHPAPWSRQARPPGTVVSTGSTPEVARARQARPPEVARARPVLGPTGPTGDRACRDHCARVRRTGR